MGENQSAKKFDKFRAAEYERESRIALAGYEACHELTACILSAALGSVKDRSILIGGVGGTAQEVISIARLEPTWRFVGVDPSAAMLALAQERLKQNELDGRAETHLGTIDDLPIDICFDAALLLGVLHHLPGNEEKSAILRSIAARLPSGAPLILACNRYQYASKPLLLAAWGKRWEMNGSTSDEVKAKLGKILQGADPPSSDDAVRELLEDAGFERSESFFSSLFWGAWIGWKK